jgi:hypothetical protein
VGFGWRTFAYSCAYVLRSDIAIVSSLKRDRAEPQDFFMRAALT